ncbi:carbonic anhydrase [Bacillus glycinifermentans]|uniref:carbonic anhydrase n=1 Tax=Bacillus glycinifermentans TaxID=1664069 RepID=A0A0J6EEH7_9BACI|nr:carbonic anhydrase [Bacillus glycinifermentans]ATH92879.1 carbonic anhydrase [Bacillus glycinifermentans]KMM53825.1 carbonic anhydrase [Bacillus glycinifermentans]KRT94606.1 carbonic anhydrase [Bacillus glycinifermentans]MEC0485726.1 carbonic anhydrase [Bacillus glycinifermentans]MEC0493669.1 carbonic anhydrase [Bacillus glycinifermentans]
MKLLDNILQFNKQFVERGDYKKYETSKFPDKKMVILSCMDTRLVELLPHSMNMRNGDVKIIKCAGALVAHPFGSIMRSILVAVYELNADEVCVIGHHDCGMSKLNSESFLDKAVKRGIPKERIQTLEYSGVDFEQWLKSFESVEDSVKDSVNVIRNHPLLPEGVPVHGLVIDPETGRLDLVVNGYKEER